MRHGERRLRQLKSCAITSVVRLPFAALALLPLPAAAQTLLPGRTYLMGGLGEGAAASADFNGDGRQDIASANYYADDIVVIFGDAAGGFGGAQLFGAGDWPVDLTLADFDADGAIDIATANRDSNDASVLLGTGDGTFGPPASLVVGYEPQDIVAADVDGDGSPDLVTVEGLSNQVSVLLGAGGGHFAPAQPSSTGWYDPMRLAAGDLDADGDVDLALAGSAWAIDEDGPVLLLHGNGVGGFGGPIVLAPFSGTNVSIADANMDGHLDLLAPSSSLLGEVGLFTGTGHGGFDPPVSVVTGAVPSAVTCADVDADGLLDLLTANLPTKYSSYGSISMLLATSPATYGPPVVIGAGGGSRFVMPLDLDHDGWSDLVTLSGGYRVITFLAEGPGIFATALALQLGNTGTADFEAADLDGNGWPDLVTGANYVWAFVLLADAAGGFKTKVGYPIGAHNSVPSGVALGDLDGDSDVDAVFSDSKGALSVLNGDGAGGFAPVVIHPVTDELEGVELGDMDLDGWLDVVTLAPNSGAWLLLNDGSGGLLPPAAHAVGPSAFALAVLDVDADGGLDIVAEKFALLSSITVLLGTHDGGFQPALTTQLPSWQDEMTLGDVDDDGFADLATANSELLDVRLGDGSGHFDAPSLSLVDAWGYDVRLADLNGDARTDLLVHDGATASLRLGDGAAGFGEPLEFTIRSGGGRLLVTDMTADGAPDLVSSSSNSGEFGYSVLSVLRNQTPDWAWATLGEGLAGAHGVPTLAGSGALVAGNVVSLTLVGAIENIVYALAIGLFTVNLPFKGGVFVPNADILLFGQPTGPLGQVTLTQAWPALAPPGFQAYFQHWILDPAGPQGFSASNAAVCTSP
jgi:hypothetical protein